MSDQIAKLQEFGVGRGVVTPEILARTEQAQLPVVVVPGGSVTISQSATELFGHIAPHHRLFLRDGSVYQLVQKHGQQVLELLKPAAACSKFEGFVQFVKTTKDQRGNPLRVPTVINQTLAEQYLSAEARRLLPEITGLINCPLLVEREGELHTVGSGYDPVTRLFVTAPIALRPMSLEDAVFYLKGAIKDFDFPTLGDRSRAIGAFITPALKFGGFLRDPIPADVAEADQSQAGKTLRQKLIAAVYNEQVNIVVKKDGAGVGSLEEALGTALVEGRPFIQLDNVRGKLNSQYLETLLTATGPAPARPAYSKVVQVDPSKFMVLINSNGYEATPDLSNRSSIVRIRKRVGHPFKPMLTFVETHQPTFLSAVFRVVEEWFNRGKPRTDDTRHDFREWAQTLDWIVQHIFGEAPLLDGHQAAQKRVSNADTTFLRSIALAVDERGQLKHRLRASELFTVCQQASVTVPGLSHEKRNDANAGVMAIGKVLGNLFGELGEDIPVEGYVVTRRIEQTSGEADKEFETKIYRFRRQTDTPE